MFEYKSPIISERRKGTSDDPYLPYSETFEVINSKVVLTEIPNKIQKVLVEGYSIQWIETDGEIKQENWYKVDYNLGIVYFHSLHNNKSLNFTYSGEGTSYFPAERVWTKEQNGDVVETLGDLIEAGKEATDSLKEINETIQKADEAIINANNAATNANNAATNANNKANLAQQSIDNVNTKITEIDEKLGTVDVKVGEINTVLTEANTTLTEIESSKDDIQAVITNAEIAVDNANTSATNANDKATYAQEQGEKIDSITSNLTYVGDYNNTIQYYKYNLVRHNGSTYICIQDSLGNAVTNKTFWQLLAMKGQDGTGSVESVNGQGGVVVLDYSDVGAIGNGGNVPIITADSLANRPTLTSDGHIFIAIDETENRIYRFNQSTSTWIPIGGTGHADSVDWEDIENKPTSFLTIEEKTKLDEVEANQNAISNIKVGEITIHSANETDTVELIAGNDIELIADTTTKTVTINSTVPSTDFSHFEYKVEAVSDNQTEFTIPHETFDVIKDKINFFVGRVPLRKDDVSITGRTVTLLNDSVNIGESLYMEILERVGTVAQETLDGSNITDDSITKPKLTQDILDSLSKADSSIPSSDIGVSVAGFNESGQVLDKNGNVVEGAVKSVNGQTGDVVVDVQTPANQAETKANDYTNTKINEHSNNANIHITQNERNNWNLGINTANTVSSSLNDTKVKIGTGTIVSGDYSIAIGYQAEATNSYSGIAIGNRAKNATAGIAIGQDAIAKGTFGGLVIGSSSTVGDQAIAIGDSINAPNTNQAILGNNNNNWTVAGNFNVAGGKNFEIPHPHPDKKHTHMIRHGAVESPTSGDTLYRYSVEATTDGQSVEVQLPDYFNHLNINVDVWVNSHKHFAHAFGEIVGDKLLVTCEKAGVYKALIIGTRNDDNVRDWHIKGVEREVGESWLGEVYIFEVDEIAEKSEFGEGLY